MNDASENPWYGTIIDTVSHAVIASHWENNYVHSAMLGTPPVWLDQRLFPRPKDSVAPLRQTAPPSGASRQSWLVDGVTEWAELHAGDDADDVHSLNFVADDQFFCGRRLSSFELCAFFCIASWRDGVRIRVTINIYSPARRAVVLLRLTRSLELRIIVKNPDNHKRAYHVMPPSSTLKSPLLLRLRDTSHISC